MTGVFIVTHMESLLSHYCFIDLKLEQFPCRKINQSFGIPYHSTAWILSLHPFIQTKRSICWFGLSCPFANLLILRTSSWASLLSDFSQRENVDLLFLLLSLGNKIKEARLEHSSLPSSLPWQTILSAQSRIGAERLSNTISYNVICTTVSHQ